MQGLNVCGKVSRAGRLLGVAAGLFLLVAQSANAAAILNFSIHRTDEAGNTTGNWGTQMESTDPSPRLDYNHNVENTNWDFEWTGFGDSDPVVTSNFVINNNTGSTQTYDVTVTSAVIPPIPGPTQTGGSVGGSITDGNGNTATLAAPLGSAVYTSIIDNAHFVKLLNHPYSVTTAPFDTAGVGPAAFGQPIPSMPGPPATMSIGIRLHFTLTAGDSASLTSNFVVVPEPAGLSVLGLGATGLLARRRRVA